MNVEKLCSSPVLLERKGNRGDKRRDLGEERLSQGGGRLFCLLDRRSFCLSHPSVTDIAKAAVFVEGGRVQVHLCEFTDWGTLGNSYCGTRTLADTRGSLLSLSTTLYIITNKQTGQKLKLREADTAPSYFQHSFFRRVCLRWTICFAVTKIIIFSKMTQGRRQKK